MIGQNAPDMPQSMNHPVFILAPPRSFTSLVCAMLGQHPELFGVPELNLFQAENMKEFWTGRDPDGSSKSPFWPVMRHGMLRTVAHLYAGEQTIESINMAERWIRVRAQKRTADVYRELCAKTGPLRLVEKSPGYISKTRHLQRLLDAFPDARFIHMTRHPRGQCQSMLNARGGSMVLFLVGSIDRSGATPVLDPQILWHDGHVRIDNFLKYVPEGHWIHVRGEDVVAETDETLARICRWLGISDSTEALDAMRHPEESPFSHVGPANARLGNDINFLESPKLNSRKGKALTLEGPLEWRDDGACFHPWVKAIAGEFGYH